MKAIRVTCGPQGLHCRWCPSRWPGATMHGCQLRTWEWVGAACSSPALCSLLGAGDAGLFPATAGTLLCGRAGTGCPTCDRVPWERGPEGSNTKGKMSSPCPSARCPPPRICLRRSKANPAQPSSACLQKQHFALHPPCRSPASRRQPPLWELGAPEVPWSPGMGWRSFLCGVGEEWPQGGLGALGGPWAGLGDSS